VQLILLLPMNLHHLCSAPHVEVYFDTSNNWLFVDWEGDLTLEGVQHACLGIARCYLQHAYPRVLNSNAQVTSIAPEVATWLAREFMSALHLAGVAQLAWVVAPTLGARNGALDAINRFSSTAINVFDDVETAVSWLQQTAPSFQSGRSLLPRPLPTEAKLNHLVEAFAQQLHATPGLTEPAQEAGH
jgi:hypothetical protein